MNEGPYSSRLVCYNCSGYNHNIGFGGTLGLLENENGHLGMRILKKGGILSDFCYFPGCLYKRNREGLWEAVREHFNPAKGHIWWESQVFPYISPLQGVTIDRHLLKHGACIIFILCEIHTCYPEHTRIPIG